MVDGIHGRDVGKEGLGSADIAGGLILANMLFPRLETEAVGGHIKKIPGGEVRGVGVWEGCGRGVGEGGEWEGGGDL